MNSEVFETARRVPIEMLDRFPAALGHVIQDATRSLIDRCLCELEKGESICSLSTPEQIQKDDLYSVEIRRTVKIERLVRCRECRWGHLCVMGQHLGLDGFCSKGEREAQIIKSVTMREGDTDTDGFFRKAVEAVTDVLE